MPLPTRAVFVDDAVFVCRWSFFIITFSRRARHRHFLPSPAALMDESARLFKPDDDRR